MRIIQCPRAKEKGISKFAIYRSPVPEGEHEKDICPDYTPAKPGDSFRACPKIEEKNRN